MNFTYQNATLLQTLNGHRNDITTCDLAPNYTLVTGSSDKTVRLWDWIAGVGFTERSYSPLMGHKYGVTSVCVSPQGCMLVSASIDGTAVLWNIHSGGRIYTITQVNGDAIRVCRFAPDSSVLVTAGDNGAFCIWDLIHRSLIRTVFQHEGATQCLAFTPDSQYLVTACSLEVINIWDVQNLLDITSDDQCLPVATADNTHDLGVLSADISPVVNLNENNALIRCYTLATSGNSNEIKIWTIQSHAKAKYENNSNDVLIKLDTTYDGHCSPVTCIRYNSSGSHLISSSLDKLVKIWDNHGVCLVTLEGHNRYVNCVAFSRDSSIAISGSNDKLLCIWDLTGNLNVNIELIKPHVTNGNTIYNTSNIQEHQVVSYAESDNKEVQLLEKIDDISEGAINSCSFSPSNTLATGSGDKLVRLFVIAEDGVSLEELNCSPLEGHTYAVNHVEFSKDGTKLASCSLDGCTCLWNASAGEKIKSLPKNSLSIKVCRFSLDSNYLVTAGDDEKATVWDIHTMREIATLNGHLDAITSACFSPDGSIIVTTSNNADFRLWCCDNYTNIFIQDDAHDLGIQSCDFSQNLEPIPNVNIADKQYYLVATCGNDSLVKLWNISLEKNRGKVKLNKLQVKLWQSLQGHGGTVFCVKFSPGAGEVICSTATDRQARIWSVYGGSCLYVLDHDSIVTSCSFSADCSLLATGCLDKTLWLWKLPQQLVFQEAVANKIKCRIKPLVDWTTNDVAKWLKNIEMDEILDNVHNTMLDGHKILTTSEERICAGLDIGDKVSERLIQELKWLKQDELHSQPVVQDLNMDVPHEFFCPITHEIMREPVKCTDGFTYERRAIAEWFMTGKYTSPMTNEVLASPDFVPDSELRSKIHLFLYGDE